MSQIPLVSLLCYYYNYGISKIFKPIASFWLVVNPRKGRHGQSLTRQVRLLSSLDPHPPMNPSSFFKQLAAVILTMAWLHGDVSASTIFWGSEFNAVLLDSQEPSSPGDPLTTLDVTFSFEVGTFGGFIPTASNLDQWVANWKVLDRAFLDDANGWNVPDQFFTGTVEHNTSGNSESPDANPLDVFTQGEKIYFWAYNSKDIVPGSEWALVTDSNVAGNLGNSWIVPDPLDPPGTSYDLMLMDADVSVFGGLNDVQGPGTYGANVPPTFRLQTAVVPEPGSALLLFGAAAAFLTRRASRRLTRATTRPEGTP